MSGKLVLLLAILSYAHYSALAKTSTVACYYTNWTTYRSGNGQYKVDNVDPTLCTHIFYAFAGITPDGTFHLLDQWADIGLHQINDIIALKQRNPNLKVLVSIGGYQKGSQNFPKVAASATMRANFISTTLAAIRQYGFDGLDLVWEFPISLDKENFSKLIQEFKATFSAYNLMLTAAVASSAVSLQTIYDIPVLSRTLDMITLMEYDYHSYFDYVTGSNAPLYYSQGTDKTKNINASVNNWLALGADPQKLVLGVPFYGKSYYLLDKSNNGLGAAVRREAPSGPYTNQQGVLGYNEICELTKQGGWIKVWEAVERVPYMYKDNIWVSYDDENSMKAKVEYAKQKNLLGVSPWALGTDDTYGLCGKTNSLLTAINQAIAS